MGCHMLGSLCVTRTPNQTRSRQKKPRQANQNVSTLTYLPAEFKEIRKEWKARKKEDENQRKAEDERARAAAVPADGAPEGAAPGYQQGGRSVQLPPIGYQPGAQVPGQYQAQAPSGGVQQLQQGYQQDHLQYSGYPASPYGAPNQMYNQRHYTLFSLPLLNMS